MDSVSGMNYEFPRSFLEKFDLNELSLLKVALSIADGPLLTETGIHQDLMDAVRKVCQGNSLHAQRIIHRLQSINIDDLRRVVTQIGCRHP